jgi:hypothetical protein
MGGFHLILLVINLYDVLQERILNDLSFEMETTSNRLDFVQVTLFVGHFQCVSGCFIYVPVCISTNIFHDYTYPHVWKLDPPFSFTSPLII